MKIFGSFFGRIENKKNCFLNYLTFLSVWGTILYWGSLFPLYIFLRIGSQHTVSVAFKFSALSVQILSQTEEPVAKIW